MNIKIFRPSKNNTRIKEDVVFDVMKQDDLKTILAQERPMIDQCGTVYYKNDRAHFGLCGIGDLHTDEMVYSRWSAIREYCHNTNLFLCYLGDIATISVNNYTNCQPQEAKFNVEDEITLAKQEIAYNAHKTLGAVGGNHDEPQQGDRLKNVYMSAAKNIITSNNIPYAPNAMLYVIDMPVYKNKKLLYYKPAYILTMHGHGKTPNERIESANKLYEQALGVMKEYNRIHQTSIVPDIILGGHFHGNSSCDFNVQCQITNSLGRVTGSYSKTVRVRECSTFSNKQSSSYNNSFSDTIIQNANLMDFRFRHNDNFNEFANNEEAQDVLEVIEFPILQRKSNNYTLVADIYHQHNLDYTPEEVKKTINKNELKKLMRNETKMLTKTLAEDL